MKVIKRDGSVVDYDRSKIAIAIGKANAEVPQEGPAVPGGHRRHHRPHRGIEAPPHAGGGHPGLVEQGWWPRTSSTWPRPISSTATTGPWCARPNTTDESILSLLRNENKELAEENSNKNTMIAATPAGLHRRRGEPGI